MASSAVLNAVDGDSGARQRESPFLRSGTPVQGS